MTKTITFDYAIGEEVRVAPIGMMGRIDSMSIDNNGPMYRVVYWNDGDRHSVWMYSWELE